MSKEISGVGQGALPPKDDQGLRAQVVERPAGSTMKLGQVVSGQYVFNPQSPGMTLKQVTPASLSGNPNLSQRNVTRIISISPSRSGQTSPLRPSLANQSIVNALTQSRTNSNIRLQLFTSSTDGNSSNTPSSSRPTKRPLSANTSEKKDAYASKLQRVVNHRIVRSKLVKEKYNEHLMEMFYLENDNNILDLYQFAKRPKTQVYLAYLNEHAIDPSDIEEETPTVTVPMTTPSTPSATPLNSLPGISSSHNQTNSTPSVADNNHTSTPKSAPKIKTPSQTSNNQEMIVEKAKQEAYVVQRIADLQKEGLWSEKRLPKVQEMPRTKAHWDFLLEEMVWLAADFAQERKWKKAAAKKCARMVQKYFQDKALTIQKAEKAQEQHIRRIAAFCAKEIKNFWNSVEKLVEYKQHTILEEKRKKALDQQLSFIVDQTEKYSQLLAEGMNKTADQTQSVVSSSRAVSDDEFDPDMQSEEDDEETIDQEEAAVGNDGHAEEVEALQKESQMELDDLLNDNFLREYILNRDNIKLSGSEDSGDDEETVEHDKKSKSSEDSESVKEDEEKESSAEEEENENTEEAKTGEDEGLEMLLDDTLKEGEGRGEDKKDDYLNDAAAIAESIQPKGNTLSSTNVSTNIPFLLKYTLREYQHIGLDWLVTMFDRKLNGILADEMGLGKTIQTIALLAHLACEKGNWGPHLIIVPTSVMLNWEMECKKWCPAFKILTYYGSQKERKFKRIGWTKPNAFHICITSYKLVVQDHQSFRRKKWKYLILDEAQNIKNFKSQRWQLLLNFQTQQRLLLTGTPLQNNLMELWSLMHFLMPNVFQSHREFKEWFSNPVTGMIEGNSEYNENIIKRLHKVLRPFLLRRLKSEVEKQMPKKYEHVVMCRLSKRQRFLYDDYMSRAKTRETLASGNLLSVINVLMQLRKVCNHPNLFEVRPTISPFQCDGIRLHIPSIVYNVLDYDPFKHIDLYSMNLLLIMQEIHLSSYQCYRMGQLKSVKMKNYLEQGECKPHCPPSKLAMRVITEKSAVPVKTEKSEHTMIKLPPQTQFKTFPAAQNVKIKVSSVRFFSQQALLKTIPVMNISQASTGQLTSENMAAADRIATNFAQLVQTSTGKHLLLTSSPSTASGNIPVTDSQGGHKLTFLSNQPVSTLGNAPQQLTKAFVKFQLGSVASTSSSNAMMTNLSTTSSAPTSSAGTTSSKADEKSSAGRLQIGNDYVSRLYSNQNNLDVRWQNNEENLEQTNEDDPKDEKKKRLELMIRINKRRCSALPLYGRDFQSAVKIFSPNKKNTWVGGGVNCLNTLFRKDEENNTKILASMLYNPEKRLEQLKDTCDRFIFYVPAVKTPEPELQVWHPPPSKYWGQQEDRYLIQRLFSKPATPLHHIASAMVTQFPDPRLIQYDCGKLQTLDRLLRRLKTDGHRVLIFTQMSKMLDVLEAFLNYHGYIYLRLDGTTKVEQRQVLMERFNGDSRIFAFILSTRSGGVGVNLTGADTVIFYDSDWNPTMDAQAQDRCHRIGQTKDVHIYRLVSEKTIEENILKKANQKRLLGDLAIEGGNFTTAYFKSSTIQDLFNIDSSEDSAANRLSRPIEGKREVEKSTSSESNAAVSDEKSAVSALENALAECEDAQDVQAAKIAKAEAVADLAEFDENIPLEDQDKDKEPEVSRAEQEINNIINKLSPIEKYAMKFIETTESAWSAEQLAAAEREIENQKREWEQNRLAALKEEEERRHRELEEESEMLTFSREDSANQIWVSDNTVEKMPMWCPPTPPQQESDVYIDQTLSFLYDTQNVMSETDLPPVYTKREAKRNRIEAELIDTRRALKLSRKEDSSTAPKSLFHSAQILKMRRDLKLQKYRSFVRPSISIPGKASVQKPTVEQSPLHEWTIHEDIALLKVVQNYLGLPMNLMAMKPGHTPNWDFVSDYVNTVSITYRSPKQCRQRYETHLIQREEDKRLGIDGSFKKKKNKIGKLPKLTLPSKTRSLRNSQLYLQDNNSAYSQIMCDRFESLKNTANKRVPATRILINNPLMNKTKNTPVLNECGIDLEHPVLPVEVAARRAERVAKEKRTLTQDQQIAAAKLQLMKGYMSNQQHATGTASTSVPSPSVPAMGTSTTQVVLTASTAPVSTITSISLPGTPTNTLRPQRVTASPVQTSSVVSVSGLSPAQLQAATQRLIVSASASGQAKAVAASTSGMQGKSISPAQLAMIRQANIKQQLRLHASTLAAQGVKTSTVTIGGQQAVVQFSQAQQRAQFVRQGTVTVSGKTGLTRTVTESEVAQLLKKQHQLQQHKLSTAGGTSTIQSISPQVLAQAIQASTSGSQVATLVKAVSSSEATQTVTIPVTGVTLTSQGKMITSTMKPTNATQLRQLHLQQQQILAQKKLAGQKLSFAQVGGKGNMPTQLIVSPKQVPTAMTVQQFQQVIRSPLNVSHTPVVLAKVPPRVIPVNTSQGTKQTVQVVAATSQALSSALTVPRGSTTLTGALAGFKNQTLITAALNQNVGMRQSSPVRIQSSSATPLVAVTVQNVQQQQQQQQQQHQQQAGMSQQPSNPDQE